MSSVKIVSGHNGTPVELEAIAPPLFVEHFSAVEGVETEWHDYVARELNGNRDWVAIGRPYVRWKLFRLSRAEYAVLAAYTGPVTITTLNQTANTYNTYNGTCKKVETNSSDAQWTPDAIGGFSDIVLEIYDLVVIP